MTPAQRHDRETAWGYMALLAIFTAIVISCALNYTPWNKLIN